MHAPFSIVQIKLATVVGMGLLLSLIGLKTAGVVVANPDTMVSRIGVRVVIPGIHTLLTLV